MTFTFHYASIKTKKAILSEAKEKLFTFHYASIKTKICNAKNKPGKKNLHFIMLLLKQRFVMLKINRERKIYISLCFY
ncbi:hypothetical protein HMPREF0378_0257 [Eubacterium nodatum ATCC 33099]|nr:hypothetical protein HMPREF0378_0257 [Eubacterium nodatum ATCC 33099]